MNSWVLFGLFIAFLVAVGVTAIWLGLKAYSLFRAVNHTQARVTPLVNGLADRAALAGERANAIALHADALNRAVTDLQASVNRLNVLIRATQEASARWSRLKSYVT